jgi:adenylylsulfate kinase-like enzyme
MMMEHQAMNSPHMNGVLRPEPSQHIWLITGPAGCGKSTVAKYLSDELALPYIEGDDVRTDLEPWLFSTSIYPS